MALWAFILILNLSCHLAQEVADKPAEQAVGNTVDLKGLVVKVAIVYDKVVRFFNKIIGQIVSILSDEVFGIRAKLKQAYESVMDSQKDLFAKVTQELLNLNSRLKVDIGIIVDVTKSGSLKEALKKLEGLKGRIMEQVEAGVAIAGQLIDLADSKYDTIVQKIKETFGKIA